MKQLIQSRKQHRVTDGCDLRLLSWDHAPLKDLLLLLAAVGDTGRSGPPQDWVTECQQTEPISVKERLALYQAALTKKETNSSAALVRRCFHVITDAIWNMLAATWEVDFKYGIADVWLPVFIISFQSQVKLQSLFVRHAQHTLQQRINE